MLGVEDRIVFAGRRPLAELPEILSACDVCLSTQTNDIPGNVRTTGKLPLYLACGRYVLASRVGEAARVLPGEMLVPYEGTVDKEYPSRLAERVRALAAAPSRLSLGAQRHRDRATALRLRHARGAAGDSAHHGRTTIGPGRLGIGDHVTPNPPLRVGVVADLLEEGWPSMDLVADMLVAHLGGRTTRSRRSC